MRQDWKPLVHTACAAAANRFAIAYGEFEYEDPFFIMIDYDGSARQPWARRDALREMSTIIPLGAPSFSEARYAALSREGDVYFIADATSNERIVGAGLASPDSRNLGEMFDFALIENELWAVGAHGQCYHRTRAGWNRVATKSLETLKLDRANFGRLVGNNAKEIYITYTLPPDEAVIPSDLEEELLKSGSWDDWENAQAVAEASRVRKTSTRGLLVWNGSVFIKMDIPISEEETIDSLYMDEKGLVYLAGSAGAIAAGNFNIGFSLLTTSMSPERIISITKLKDIIYYLTISSFMKIENGNVFKVTAPATNINPLKLEAANEVLFYFDRQAKVALFDGKGWKEVSIPPALLRRNFGTPS